jgi:hypothetical protein
MTATHLFRAVLVTLAAPKSLAAPVCMPRSMPPGFALPSTATPPDAKAWRRAFDVALIDPSGWLNLAAALSAPAAAQARAAAACSLALLSEATPEAFAAVFLWRPRLASVCDYWFHVRVPAETDQNAANGLPNGKRKKRGKRRGGSKSTSISAVAELRGDQPSWR